LRRTHGTSRHKLIPLAEGRANRPPIVGREEDVAQPERIGVQVLEDFPLAVLREYIDWTPFFHTWELKGVYPRIFEHEKYGAEARQIFAEGNALPGEIVAKKLITARAVYGLFPANAAGDDVELYSDETRGRLITRFHFLRQQAQRDKNDRSRCLADYIAPKGSGLRD